MAVIDPKMSRGPALRKRKISDQEASNYNINNEEEALKAKRAEEIKKQSDPVEIVNTLRKSGIDARAFHKANWDKNWDLYNNNYDFTMKADWQSKNFISLIPVIVRGIKYLIKRSVVTSGDFFDVDFPAIPKDSKYKNEVNVWGRQILRRFLDQNKFASLISEATCLSLLESLLILKVLPQGNTGITITCDSAYNLILDPTGRGRWMIHSIDTDFDIVQERAEEGIYDKAEVAKCVEEFSRQPEATDAANRKQQETQPTVSPPNRKGCVVEEFYGDLIGADGKVIMKRCAFSILNEKYLIRKPFPIKEKLEHGRTPIVVGAINPKPKSVYHQALVSDISGLAHMATELLNLTLDSNLMSMAKGFELDLGMVADPADLVGGVVPGKTFKKKPGNQGKRMIEEINISGPTQQDFLLLEKVKAQAQGDVGFFNEFQQGSLGARPGGRATAREVAERSSTTSSSMTSLAEEIEEQVIQPMLEMAWSNLCQYFTDFDQLDGILPQELIDFLHVQKDGLTALFGDAAKFQAKGMSGVLNRMEELQKIEKFAGFVKMFPQIMPFLKGTDIFASVITNFGWSRDKYMMSEQEIAAAQQAAAQKAAAMPPQGPGGMPPGMPPQGVQ